MVWQLLLVSAAMAQDAVDHGQAIAKVVDTARTFDSNLRNFVCRQSVQRLRGQSNDGPWSEIDRYEDEVAYFDRKERYRLLTINGKPTTKKHEQMRGGFRAGGLFGAMLSRVFALDTKAEFEWARMDRLDGREAMVLRFRVRKDNSKWTINGNGKTYVRGYSGLVWADVRNSSVLRLETMADAEPGDPSWIGSLRLDLRYGVVPIGGVDQLLPIQAEARIELNKKPRKNIAEFRDFKQYASESKIDFEEVK